MSYPKNPETIILKNKYYPKGISELMVWDYYQKVKVPLMKEVYNRDLMFYIMVGVNKPIIKRKLQDKYIRLEPSNYDQMITGRTLSIHSAMKGYEDFAIIDVDLHPSDGFKWAKETTYQVYSYAMDKIPIIRKADIRYTGKGSFHIVCHFGRKLKTDATKFLLEKFLRESPLSKVYTVNAKKAYPGVPNLDLNRNCLNCNYITLHSLSILGLRCMEIPFKKLMGFDPSQARI
jgi:hypothetical protein